MICPSCKRDFPGDLLAPVLIGETKSIVCTLCAKKLLAQHYGLPEDAPLEGRGADLERRTLEYLAAQEAKSHDWISRWFAAMPAEWQAGLWTAIKGGVWVGDLVGQDKTDVCVCFIHARHMPKIMEVFDAAPIQP